MSDDIEFEQHDSLPSYGSVNIQLEETDELKQIVQPEIPANLEESDEFAEIVRQDENPYMADGDIHMFKQSRGKKSDTVITGLIFATPDENKQFLKKIKTKFGIGGCHKLMEDMVKNELVFVFTGDYREKIKKLLINEYGKDSKSIKIHG